MKLKCPMDGCEYTLNVADDAFGMQIILTTNDFKIHLRKHSVDALIDAVFFLALTLHKNQGSASMVNRE